RDALLVEDDRSELLRRVGRAVLKQAMQQEYIEHPDRPFGNDDRREGVEVHEARLDVLDAALAQCMQRALGGPDHALRTDRAVDLVLDLQQAGRELPIAVAVANPD